VRAAVFLGADLHDAEDLAQTTLVRCYSGWERVRGVDNRDAYVYRMLLNALRDTRRTRWWRSRVDVDLDGVVDDRVDALALADAVHRALSKLSKVNREVVVLRYFVQLTEAQTASVLAGHGQDRRTPARHAARRRAAHLRRLRAGRAAALEPASQRHRRR